jgi:hypothetical protein
LSVRRKVSEKSLELNVGAELLALFRGPWGMPKAYLRGLTQSEEEREGPDFYVELDPASRLFAFQFKAPKGGSEAMPYRYTLKRQQHRMLRVLARIAPRSAYYVFPFYVTPAKLRSDVPQLLQDTWLLQVDGMRTRQIFGTGQSRTIRCQRGVASVNPEYKLLRPTNLRHLDSEGIPVKAFAAWYKRRKRYATSLSETGIKDPWLVRGLRVVIVPP